MKKWILFFFVCLSIAGLGHSQTLTLTAPDGGEHWSLGSTQNINWTSSGVTADVKLVLKGKNAMPGFAEMLSPTDLAAVITFQRNAFGNSQGDLIQPSAIQAHQ